MHFPLMESRTNNLNTSKEKIISFLKINGPCVPVKLSTHLGINTIIAGAFLSDLLSDKQIKISNMKVGNSPIYFLPGQETHLENFSNYLGSKEREAFEILKERKIIRDNSQEPAIRVALRSIKDFAFPFQVRGEIFWRYYSVNQEEAIGKIIGNAEKRTPVIEKIKQVFVGEPKPEIKKPLVTQEFNEKNKIESTKDNFSTLYNKSNKNDLQFIEQKEKIKLKEKSDFVISVEEFLKNNNIPIVGDIEHKKKEFTARIQINSQLGKLNAFCIAKDKKTITESDINDSLVYIQNKKIPVLLLIPSSPNKKVAERLNELGNLIFFKKLE